MKQTLLQCFLLLLIFATDVSGQNLVTNPSFETVTAEPFWGCELTNATGWLNPSGGPCPTNSDATPDLFSTFSTGQAVLPNSFMGTTSAHTGDRIAGIVTYHQQLGNYREYLMTQLSCALVPGQTYTVSFWTTGGNPVEYIYHSNNIGIYFSTSALTQSGYNLIPGITPQFEETGIMANSAWTYYTYTFTPNQAFAYMAIGNYKDDGSTQTQTFGTNRPYAYYFFDDISVIPVGIPAIYLGPDTSYCGSFTHILSTGNPNTVWSTGVTAAQITVTTTGTYWASIASGCITGSDTIVISSGTSPVPFTLGPDTAYCGSFSHTFSSGNPNTLWSTGITSSQITVSNGGTYSATVSNGCGTASDTVVLTQNIAPVVNLGSNATLCTGQTLLLDATSTGATYHWQDNSTNATFNVTGAGTYSVTVTNATGCAATGSIDVSYNTQAPVVNLGADTEICGNQGVVLRANVLNANYLWSDNSIDSVLTVSSTGTYSLTVSTGCGSATDAVNIQIHADACALLIPTAFSPNGDGANDVFRAVSRCPVSRYSLNVYNRWGESVFETTYPDEGWNGVFRSREQPLGVYAYYVDYFNYCEQKMKKVVGNVTLVR